MKSLILSIFLFFSRLEVNACFVSLTNNNEKAILPSINYPISDGDGVDITCGDLPQIGDVYVQRRYDSDSQSIIEDTWEYKPGVAMYDLPDVINIEGVKIPNLSNSGWILKKCRIEKGSSSESTTYLFRYDYKKDRNGDWRLTLHIENKKNGKIVKNVDLIPHNVNIEEVKDVDSLINMLIYQPESSKRDEIIKQIGKIDRWKLYFAKNISTLLYSDKDIERMKAVQQVGKEMEASALDALCLALLNDDSVNVRFNAVWALGKLKNARAIELLEKVALNEKESTDTIYNVRAEAVWALGEIGEYGALDTLNKILFQDKTHPTLREHAVASLVKIEGEDALPVLERLLFQEQDSGVRVAILNELGNIGSLEANKILLRYLENKQLAKGKYEVDTIENILATKGRKYLGLLLDAYRNSEIRANIKTVFEKIGSGDIYTLIKLVESDSSYRKEAKKILILIGNSAFVPVVENLLFSKDSNLQKDAVSIIKGIAAEKSPQKTGVDPDIDIISLNSMSKEDLEDIASSNKYSITKALALYYIGKKYQDEEFLRDYIFNDNGGKLTVKNKDISKLEMAAILNTGIPAEAGWWSRLVDKKEKIKYIKLVLKGDFTDEKSYIIEREWICVQYATQLLINAKGFDNLQASNQIADKEAFQNWGTGYFIQDLKNGYGLPMFYVEDGIHAYDAVFVGDNLFDKESKINPEVYNINNWILIEPQDDSFTPKHLGRNIHIYLKMRILPDGEYEGVSYEVGSRGSVDKITLDTSAYPYK